MLITQQLIDQQFKRGKIILLIILIVFLITAPIVKYYLYSNYIESFLVSNEEMEPNYFQNERYAVYKDVSSITRGKVVVFKPLDAPDKLEIQRVIGLPGDKISFKEGSVYIDGKRAEEPYLEPETETTVSTENSAILEEEVQTIPVGYYFLLGDNREVANDSRSTGFVLNTQIKGLIAFCYSDCKK